jgi:hypothetical protein
LTSARHPNDTSNSQNPRPKIKGNSKCIVDDSVVEENKSWKEAQIMVANPKIVREREREREWFLFALNVK